MCTVIVSIAPDGGSSDSGSPDSGSPDGSSPNSAWPVVMLGMRDELVTRAWDPPGAWWPDLGEDVRGIRDREAGGAWLAINGPLRRASVVLNRGEESDEPAGGWTTRGALPLLGATTGLPTHTRPTTRTFNLLEVVGTEVHHTSWDGQSLTTTRLAPGVHMLTHEGPDDPVVPRVRRWLPAFRDAAVPAGPIGSGTWDAWLGVLRTSTQLDPTHPEALLRREGPGMGAFTSLSVTAVAVGTSTVSVEHARLSQPGQLDAVLDWR